MKNKLLLIIKIIFIVHIFVIFLRFLSLLYKSRFCNLNSADKIFQQNKWNNNYMFGLLVFKSGKNKFLDYFKLIKERFKLWEDKIYWYKKYKIKGIIEVNYKDEVTDVINYMNNSKPPTINGRLLPYKIIFLYKSQKIMILLNHFYCDGKILYEIITTNFLNSKSEIKFINYNYLPFYYEFLLLKYLGKLAKNSIIKKNTQGLTLSKNQSSIYRKIIYYNGNINRWIALAINFNLIFKYVKLNSLKIAFTVGFEDNIEYCNNRIGVIIVDVPRLNSIEEYQEFIKKKLISNKYDALASYDLIRNFQLDKLRGYFDTDIDIVLTSFKLDGEDKDIKDCNINDIDYSLGSFIGIGRIPIYIFSMTLDYEKKIKICIKSTTPDFNIIEFQKNEEDIEHIYSWDN